MQAARLPPWAAPVSGPARVRRVSRWSFRRSGEFFFMAFPSSPRNSHSTGLRGRRRDAVDVAGAAAAHPAGVTQTVGKRVRPARSGRQVLRVEGPQGLTVEGQADLRVLFHGRPLSCPGKCPRTDLSRERPPKGERGRDAQSGGKRGHARGPGRERYARAWPPEPMARRSHLPWTPFIIFCIERYCLSRRLISATEVPEPMAIRFLRPPLRTSGRRRSRGVIELMIASTFLRPLSSTFAESRPRRGPTLGSISSTEARGPSLRCRRSGPRRSSRVNCWLTMRLARRS